MIGFQTAMWPVRAVGAFVVVRATQESFPVPVPGEYRAPVLK
jgi:hypothetical protein